MLLPQLLRSSDRLKGAVVSTNHNKFLGVQVARCAVVTSTLVTLLAAERLKPTVAKTSIGHAWTHVHDWLSSGVLHSDKRLKSTVAKARD